MKYVMLELVAEAHRSQPHDSRTGASDLLREFQVRQLYALSQSVPDKLHIIASTKEAPTGLPGEIRIYSDPSWSLLRPKRHIRPEDEALEPCLERTRRAFRFNAGGCVLPPEDKGKDVTHLYMRNVQQAAVPRAAMPAASGAAGGKRRAGGEAISGEHQQVSGDTGSLSHSHESKRPRNY